MERRTKKIRGQFLAIATACAVLASAGVFRGVSLTASATNSASSSELQEQIDTKQGEIDSVSAQIQAIQAQISEMESEADLIEEQLASLESELVNLMTDIALTEDEIASKENELEEIAYEIEQTRGEYEAATRREEQQYRDMVVRIRTMYERGEQDLISLLLAGNGISDLLNQMDLVEKLYAYDRGKLDEFTATKEEVAALAERLDAEQGRLEAEKAVLDEQKASLEGEKAALDEVQASLQAQADDYESLIKKASQQAAVASQILKQEQAELKNLQSAQREALAREQAAALALARGQATSSGGEGTGAATGTTETNTSAGTDTPTVSSTNYDSIIDAANGSDLGKQIAKYACQFIGNPYVYGGTSLTNGADCSGFTMRIYANYGYSIPRSSYAQQSAGTAVSYADAQPGDIICYSGHVAIYLGSGLIVHASTPKGGIKVGSATYTTIVTVRRIIN